ncbi:spermatogenesis-associated protein 1 [Hypanus sabinus]|uniref:spermatogenesis-associated protein 1 n=1 Tax=Hypanus sabinus TaxID=79690 RepID=UPI0028C4EDEF|nr:spermatogenesis-associated protein 1 [Hypanus sabinus]
MEAGGMNCSGSRRAPSAGVLELHVFYVPAELWNSTLNTVSTHTISKFVSVGFVRVLPELSLKALRPQLGSLLGTETVNDKFAFLKCVGRSLAVVRTKQELELKVKSFAPPHAPQPELYLLPVTRLVAERQMSSPVTPGAQQDPVEVTESYLFHPSLPPEGSDCAADCKSSDCFCQLYDDKERGRVHACLTESSNREENATGAFRKAETLQRPRTPEVTRVSLPLLQRPASTNSENGDFREFKGNDYSWQMDKTKSLDVYSTWEQESSPGNSTEQSHRKTARIQQDDLQREQWRKDVSSVGERQMPVLKSSRIHSNNTMDSGIPESLDDRDLEYLENQRKKSQQVNQGPVSGNIEEETSQMPGGCRELNYPVGGREYSLPPPPPLLTAAVQRARLPTAKGQLIAQIEAVKQERKSLEKTRQELVKKARALLSQIRLRQNQVRDSWKKQYFVSKKATAPLEDTSSKLWQELDMFYQKLLHHLAARETRKRFPNSASAGSSKNDLIIQITTLKHEVDQLYHRVEHSKMKLVTEIKLRKQTVFDLRALRAEMLQKMM